MIQNGSARTMQTLKKGTIWTPTVFLRQCSIFIIAVLYVFSLHGCNWFRQSNPTAPTSCWSNFYKNISLQQNSQWCWAAGLQMVLAHNEIKMEQCEIVSSFYAIPACQNPALSNFPARSMYDLANYLCNDTFSGNVRFSCTCINGDLLMNSIKAEIDNCRPIMVEIKTSPFSNSTHLILLTGYYYEAYSNVLWLTVVDPYPYTWSSVVTNGVNQTNLALLLPIWKSTIYGIQKIQ